MRWEGGIQIGSVTINEGHHHVWPLTCPAHGHWSWVAQDEQGDREHHMVHHVMLPVASYIPVTLRGSGPCHKPGCHGGPLPILQHHHPQRIKRAGRKSPAAGVAILCGRTTATCLKHAQRHHIIIQQTSHLEWREPLCPGHQTMNSWSLAALGVAHPPFPRGAPRGCAGTVAGQGRCTPQEGSMLAHMHGAPTMYTAFATST